MSYPKHPGKWMPLLVFPILFCCGAMADETVPPSRAAARRHLEFMQFLGESQVPLDSMEWTEELLDDCHLDNHELGIVRLQRWEWLAKPYLRDLCGPLGILLEPQAPCESGTVPDWCRSCDEVAGRMNLDSYFDEMEQAIAASEQELVRFNILFLMTEILHWMPTSFNPYECEGAADRWFSKSVTAFLRGAHPADVARIEEQLRGLFKKLPDPIARELRSYAESHSDPGDEDGDSQLGTEEP